MTEPNGCVALYARLSPRPDGTYEGVDDQEKRGRAYAAKTWPGLPVRVFADAGISAANGDHRPGYEALREAVRAGEVAHLWAVEQTRLERREAAWFTLAAELEAAGIAEVHTRRDGIVRVGEEVAGIKAVLAAAEVRRIKRRVNDRLEANAEKGRPPGGRIYGYRRVVNDAKEKTLTIDEDEAAIIRQCAERILAGWSLATITADLNVRGVTGTLSGAPLRYTAVRSWLTSPTVAGRRIYRGEDIGAGNWPPILDVATWRAVRQRLSGPRLVALAEPDAGGHDTHKVVPSARARRRYVLTGGLAVCGVCGAPLRAGLRKVGKRTTGYYQCGGGFCVSAPADTLEAVVKDLLRAELAKPAFLAALAQDGHAGRRDELAAGIDATAARRAELARERARGEITRDEWAVMREELESSGRRLRAELAGVTPPCSRVDPEVVREGLDALNVEELAEVLRMFIVRVTLGRSRTTGRAPFDVARVAVTEWRTA